MNYPYYGIDDEMMDRKGPENMVKEIIHCLKEYDKNKELAKAFNAAGFKLPKLSDKEICCTCNKEATYMRMTQFSGDHPFCEEHAKQEEDFGKEDPSYFFWKEIK